MSPPKNPFEDRRPWIKIVIPPIPQFSTITILALGFLIGNLLFLPMIAYIGRYVPEAYMDSVSTIAALFKDGMLLILGYYFRDKQGNGEPAGE